MELKIQISYLIYWGPGICTVTGTPLHELLKEQYGLRGPLLYKYRKGLGIRTTYSTSTVTDALLKRILDPYEYQYPSL
jgi:hypothetical protein